MKAFSFHIEPATRKDAYTLLVLSRAFFAYAAFTSRKIEKRLANPRVRYLLAKTSGQTIGFVDYALYRTHAKLLGVAVLPEYRGKGVARKLVERALSDIRKTKKYQTVFLMAEPDNAPALAIYEKFGFRKHADSKKRLYGKPLILLKLDLP